MTPEYDIPVGSQEIAERLGVQPSTVHVWRVRDAMPAPDFTLSGRPAWWWSTIEQWAIDTGRLED